MQDYHLHTSFSGDVADLPLNEVCELALAHGLTEIAITDHKDFDPNDPTYSHFDYPLIADAIAQAREQFAGKLKVKLGVEIDYQRRFETEIRNWLIGKNFDYVLGAIHYINGHILDINTDFLKNHTEDEIYIPYLEAVEDAVESGIFDSIAHVDLCKRRCVSVYGAFKPEKYKERLHLIFEKMVNYDIALEINASGLRQEPAETYPGFETIKLFRSFENAKIVIGSDSHRRQHVGYGVKEARIIAFEAGFDSIATFDKRKCSIVPLQISEAQK